MSLLKSIPIIGKFFSDATDIVKEIVVDKDAQNRILGKLEQAKQAMEQELHLKELDTKTVPWVDALHKMGRQNLNLFTILLTFNLLMLDKAISFEAMTLLGGGNVAYQLIKRKGK